MRRAKATSRIPKPPLSASSTKVNGLRRIVATDDAEHVKAEVARVIDQQTAEGVDMSSVKRQSLLTVPIITAGMSAAILALCYEGDDRRTRTNWFNRVVQRHRAAVNTANPSLFTLLGDWIVQDDEVNGLYYVSNVLQKGKPCDQAPDELTPLLDKLIPNARQSLADHYNSTREPYVSVAHTSSEDRAWGIADALNEDGTLLGAQAQLMPATIVSARLSLGKSVVIL